ncbi:D-alanyl-D-alanine carboxypeptidase [Listeria floridensis FSL S10-1187]|uniref:D-alanyl-D-alanine carboxypeptidase n=1 Tax=Listeria floridensis FSL S10-1187 TaxID=1265817 RepID=A0ABP3AZJ7_9LIST|nr:M15 family metallopeptidase [Listeria floridensis]EUJ33006.1 D-alanyl-D-alanine carboxypeptidase [Listeria floridensis FSL S10-1187]
MKTFISLMIAIMIAVIQTVFGTADDQSTKSNQTNTTNEKEEAKLEKLKKDPLYSFINKQNKLMDKDGTEYIQNEDNLLILANKDYLMQSSYIPKDLVRPNVEFSFGDQQIEKAQMRKAAADGLAAMFSGAKTAGYDLYAVSGYRSYARQQEVYQAEVNAKGVEKAGEAVAVPGTSEHQTGLAMDISSRSANFNLSAAFGETPEGKWAKENAYKYGFILRYPSGKEAITKYEYEAWHFRYVGKEAAEIIYKHDWTLEEFFEQVKLLDDKVKKA